MSVLEMMLLMCSGPSAPLASSKMRVPSALRATGESGVRPARGLRVAMARVLVLAYMICKGSSLLDGQEKGQRR